MCEGLSGRETFGWVELEKAVQEVETMWGGKGQNGFERLGLLDLELQEVRQLLYLWPIL
jgi:hypothetical protein